VQKGSLNFCNICMFIHEMGIGDEIKQKEFANFAEKAIVNISYTNSYFSGLINSALKEHKTSLQQFNVLRILQGQHPKPVSVNEITLLMVDKMSNASRLVDKLCTKELVVRGACLYDKRQVDVSITQHGQKTLKILSAVVDKVILSHQNLSSLEFDTLNQLLDKLREKD
jgi:DNA-binding MarR family transcriptional regulator